jgi:hypothetical protein
MTDTHSSHQWLSEAQSLAFSGELLAFCDAQHAFIDRDVDEEVVRQKAVGLAREARRRRLEPQVLLFAMELGGCYRSNQLENRADPEPARRYFTTLHYLLASYYGSASRPAERRLAPRIVTDVK